MRNIVRGTAFDSAAARLGISVRALDELVMPIEAVIAADPETYPLEPGTPFRVAHIRTPRGSRLVVRYLVGVPYRPGETRCVLDHVVSCDQ